MHYVCLSVYCPLCSHYLYTITHPDKYGKPQIDLSEDKDVSDINIPPEISSPAIERIIAKVFLKYKCDVVVTDRLRSVFVCKLQRMGRAIQRLGGYGRSKLLDKWKETKWNIELEKNEILPRKRKPDNALIESAEKRYAACKNELTTCRKELQAVTNQLSLLQKSNKKLSSSLKRHNPSISKGKRKSWTEYTSRYKRMKTKQLATDVKTALSFVEDENFAPTKVNLRNKETGEIIHIAENGDVKVDEPKAVGSVKKTLYVKEKFHISNNAYHELAMLNPKLPRLCEITREAKQLNAQSNIYPTPEPTIGVQQSLRARLTKRLQHLITVMQTELLLYSTIKVKITADGTQVSRSLHPLVIAFTIIDEGENPNSADDNHIIALIHCQEKYPEISAAVKDIAEEIAQIDTIKIGQYEFKIEFMLGADWKFLAMSVGIESATADYFCIWCKCKADERYDTSKTLSISDTQKSARTISEIQELASLRKKKGNQKYGCINQPLFPTIQIDHVIPDILHLFLRISDTLINLLIMELRRMDGIEKIKIKEFNKSNASFLHTYVEFLNQNCKISFHMYLQKDTSQLKWRDLTGPEKLKLFKKLKIPEIFPTFPQSNKVQEIWDGLLQINEYLWSGTIDKKEKTLAEFKSVSTKWIRDFLTVYHTRHVTPYMHLLIAHIPEFLRLYGSLAPYSQQGLEKLNDDVTKMYYRGTNHRIKEALEQILLKRNRTEELARQSCSRTKRLHKCTLCGKSGHNARNCYNS